MTNPSKLLDAAEQEFRQHRFAAGADLVWDAVYQSVVTAAGQADLPCRNAQEAYDVATLLDQQHSVEPVHHWIRLRLADTFRTQAAHYGEDGDWQWAPDEYIESMAGIRLMVNQISQNGATVQ